MRAREFLGEAGPAIGRRYQHIEDLVFTNGSTGGLHAAERLRSMGAEGGTIELKWDGSPVVYWGRDAQGRFGLIPKNAWEYLKRGKTELEGGIKTAIYSPQDLKNFVAGTGRVEPGQEKQRQQFANNMASLWPLFEKVSPKKGYLEGGILFSPWAPPALNPETNEYDFQPNVTAFHVPATSELGQRIGQARLMVAATGYYESLGSSEEKRFPDAQKLSTKDVIVQGTTYVEQAPEIDTGLIDRAESYIEKNAALIDGFLSPQPGLSKPGEILYKFYNQNLRVEGVKQKFGAWAQNNLSSVQAQKVLSNPGLEATLTAVELLTRAKTDLISKLSQGTHGGVRQTRPEGYVQAHPGRPFKSDIPGQFVKAIDQASWAPRKD
jgi:hypothetical protein